MTEWHTRENKWSFGNCSASHRWVGPGTYAEKCCLSEGIHLLTCKTTRHRNDWSTNVVMMFGHRFCEDFVGYEDVIALNITGICK